MMHENHAEVMRLRAVVNEYEAVLRDIADLVAEYDDLPEYGPMTDSIDLLDAIVDELRKII